MISKTDIDPRHDSAPPEVRVREAQKLALLMSADDALPPEEDLTQEEIQSMLPPRPLVVPLAQDPLQSFSEILKRYGDHSDVRVNTPIGVIVLKALHVSINQTGVGIILSKDDMQLEPAFGSELLLEIDGRAFPVIYGGGLFTFKKIPVTFLSFFRLTKPEETAQEAPL
jgi:hypothetical protein